MPSIDADFQQLLQAPGAEALYSDPATPRLRLRVFDQLPAGVASLGQLSGSGLESAVIGVGAEGRGQPNTFPAKEWAITDDVLNISDTASVTIANDNGQHSGKFALGQRVEIDEADPTVAGGQWKRQFTGRITQIETSSDLAGGSNIALTMMDLGWHLTSCHGRPLVNIRSITFDRLLRLLIDPTWGFAPTNTLRGNDLNRRLKHGRQVVVQNFNPQLRAVLPFIQIEPGQTPFDILRLYAQRDGVLVNVGARGELILFRPRYDTDGAQVVHFHGSTHPQRHLNNVIGRPSYRESIDGMYSEVQCWSTTVIPPQVQNTTNPNEAFRHTTILAQPNPLPFYRRWVMSDSEAISDALRRNRATWALQMGMFNSFIYECELPVHSQGGGLFVTDTMIAVNDTVNQVQGYHYLQAVRRSLTLRDGLRSKLTLRRPGLLDPTLQALPDSKRRRKVGGGARNVTR